MDGLYEAEVAVDNREAASRLEALGRALAEVVVKVSGRREASGLPPVREAIAEPEGFIADESYTENFPRGDGLVGLGLRVAFGPEKVDELVRGAGLPVWGRSRPGILTWVGVDEAGVKRVLAGWDESGLAQAARGAGRARGIAVSLPLMDLEDELAVSAPDIWAPYDAVLAQASARYAPEVVLVARLSPGNGGEQRGDFELILPEGRQAWSARGPGAGDLLASAVDEAADRVAAAFAGLVLEGEPGAVSVRVVGVSDIAAYARILRYFESLDQIDDLSVRGLTGEELAIDLTINGGAQGLRRLVAYGTVLEPAEEPSQNGTVLLRLRP